LIKRKIAVSGKKRLLNREKGKRFETKPFALDEKSCGYALRVQVKRATER
jgi:hypothetical protein